ncbi:hypothetical protein PMAYCL1PPCAC_06182, partial [Pristionchus mayeri]
QEKDGLEGVDFLGRIGRDPEEKSQVREQLPVNIFQYLLWCSCNALADCSRRRGSHAVDPLVQRT